MSNSNTLLEPYVPRFLVTWLRESPDELWREIHGSLAFVDISGFTQLTERLARKGKVGAEEMSDILNATFADLLEVAYRDGAALVKWGGDAVLLLFEGDQHAARAARAAHQMRARMRKIGRLKTSAGRIELRMSVGIHSGAFHFFLIGDPAVHRELIISGPAASRTAEMEALADAGEIGLSPQTAELLHPSLLGEAKGEGWLLGSEPVLDDLPIVPRPPSDGIDIAGLLPPAIRHHVMGESGETQHRQIAVAFVQFSGTDALLAEHGPDTLAAALDQCVRNVQEATSRHGVTFFESDINRDGGKIMLTAGAPLTADHDEERMLRAARRIIEAEGTLPLRIGVNCGPVFSGDFGPPFRKTFSVKGDAINLAARVMGKAQPGQVLSTLEVVERSRSRFDIEPLPPFMVKGKSEPVAAAVIGPLLGERAAAVGTETPLVGRVREMGLLRSALVQAWAGHGSVVDLAGEPGIGKSRLVKELLLEAETTSYASRCDEYETATAYWPFRLLLRRILDVDPEAADEVVVAALQETAGRHVPDLVPWLPLIGQILDVEMPSTPQVDAIDERFRKDRLEEVTAGFVQRVLTDPTVIVVDDVHLMDDASVDLLERICQGLSGRPWLVLLTRRDIDDGFRPSSAYEVIPLRPAPLDADDAAALVQEALRDSPLTPHDVAVLTERAGGNPLFLRGLVLAARTGASIDALPTTVEALITSQIDRLRAEERQLLRYAAVLGLRFQESELRALLGAATLELTPDAVRRLSYFIRPETPGRYRFDHQLIRDTAYEGLPYRTRLDLHSRAGEIIESTAADPDDVAELLSMHFLHAAKPEKAWYYACIAGDRASGKYAYAQAEELLARAVLAARSLKDIPDADLAQVNIALAQARLRLGRQAQALEAFRAARKVSKSDQIGTAALHGQEGQTLLRMGRFPLALRTLSRGLRLLDGLEDPAGLAARARLEARYAVVRETQGRYRDALEWARRAERHAEESGDAEALADALAAIQQALMMLGLTLDRPYGELALALYERLGDRGGQSRTLNNIAVLAWIQGRGNEALDMFTRAETIAAESGDTVGAATTRYNIGDVLLHLGRAEEAVTLLRPLLPVLQALGVDGFHACARRGLGLALVLSGERSEGLDLLDQARVMLDEIGESAEVVETDAAIAFAMLIADETDAAITLADDAASRADDLDAGYLLPLLLRLQGAGLCDVGRVDEAEDVLRRALALADAEGRAERGFILAELARVAEGRGDSAVARDFQARSGEAFDELGFLGMPRYRR